MAEKVSTLVIEAECEKCYKKLQKIVCKLQGEQQHIKNISYDDDKTTVTISGTFDPEKLSKKLRCKASRACLDIKIKTPPPPEPKKPEEKPKPKKKKTTDAKKADGKEPKEKAPAPASTTVNVSLVCQICYPWPCTDPSHLGLVPQKWPCYGVPALPGNDRCPQQWGFPPRSCGAGSSCHGGCSSCGGGGGGGYRCPPTPGWCPGPPSCRGCKGCRIVHEEKFRYEEYPPAMCAVM